MLSHEGFRVPRTADQQCHRARANGIHRPQPVYISETRIPRKIIGRIGSATKATGFLVPWNQQLRHQHRLRCCVNRFLGRAESQRARQQQHVRSALTCMHTVTPFHSDRKTCPLARKNLFCHLQNHI